VCVCVCGVRSFLISFTSDCAPFHVHKVVCAVGYLHEGCVFCVSVCVRVCVCGVRSFLISVTDDCDQFHLHNVVCAVGYLHERCVSVCVCVCVFLA